MTERFWLPARILHWLMAVLVIAMLFIGAGMVSTVSRTHEWLFAIHKPLGFTIFVLVIIRLIVRLVHKPPPMPEDMPGWMRHAATLSHWLLYALMFFLPLLGWSTLSAAGYPIQLAPHVHLPPIAPHNLALYTFLRDAHGFGAYLLFFTYLTHLGAALFHHLVRKDGVLASMLFGKDPAG
ncbi:cytochrome b [Pinirhizobacter sp.]|jgi:cytochrome b561|uniref:cytochrome b n=1 Tax=Pinirhizobacter sp. TaxID=2950432 RepID=UPI002F3FF475